MSLILNLFLQTSMKQSHIQHHQPLERMESSPQVGKQSQILYEYRINSLHIFLPILNISGTEQASPNQHRQSCRVKAHSYSGGFAMMDGGNNFCNIFDLFCANKECHPFTKLSYTYAVGRCTKSDVKTCFSDATR